MAILIDRVGFSDMGAPELIRGTAWMEESEAHTFRITPPAGRTYSGDVLAHVLRADDVSIAVDGEIDSDGRVILTLVADCYHVPGRLQVAIYLTDTENVNAPSECVYACITNVHRTVGGTELDSGTTVPTLAQMEAAYQDCMEAIQSVPHAILYDQQTLTEEQKAQARQNIGAGTGGGGGVAEGSIAAVEAATAIAAHSVGDHVMLSGVLYRVTAAIAVGDTITSSGSGANVTAESAMESQAKIAALALGDFQPEAYGVDATLTNRGLTITKKLNEITVDGTRTGYGGMVNVNSADGTIHAITSNFGQNTFTDFTSPLCVLRAGKRYRITAQVISGTISDGTATDKSYVMWYHGIASAEHATQGIMTEDAVADIANGIRVWHAYYEPAADELAGYGFICRKGTVFGNLVLRFTFEEAVDADMDVAVSGTAVTITARKNHRYLCSASAMDSISITPCAAGLCEVRFKTGNATALTVPSAVKWPSWFDPTSLDASTVYDIMISDGVYGAVMKWA